MQHVSVLNPFTFRLNQWRIQRGGFGGSGPPSSPIRPDDFLRLKFLHRQDRISLFNWLFFFLMKQELHFATKLNSRDIQKCNYFSVPSYDLFASARKAVFLAPMATGVHQLRKTWSSLLSQLVDNYGTREGCSKGASFTSTR